MPWKETNPVLERYHFAQDLESGHWTMIELCMRYGISRNTGYKWLEQYLQEGPRGLLDRSRAPRSIPHQTSAEVVALILDEHRRYGWGPRKILKRLRTRDPQRAWPARSTILDILARHGHVAAHRGPSALRRHRIGTRPPARRRPRVAVLRAAAVQPRPWST